MNDLSKVCEVKLVYKTKYNMNERPKVRCSKDAYEIFLNEWDMDTIEHTESFKLMLLNNSSRVLGVKTIAFGGINGIVVDIRIIMQYALKANASFIIICHNHPSGNLAHGERDDKVTRDIRDAGKLLRIELNDHLIIIKSGYFSYADEGLILYD